MSDLSDLSDLSPTRRKPTPGITEPVPAPLQRLLRREVVAAARHDQRRNFPATVHVGLPGLPTQIRYDVTLPDPATTTPTDHALRSDIISAMLQAHRRFSSPLHPVIWLRRPGPLTPLGDADLAWLAAAHQAHHQAHHQLADLGLPDLAFICLNRTGWRDPRSGVGRCWKRLPRDREPQPAANPGQP